LLLDSALERADSIQPVLRTNALFALSRLVLQDGEVEPAHAIAEESRRRSEELGDRATLLRALLHLERTTILRGELDRAATLCEESRQLAVELGDRNSDGAVYNHMARLALPNDLPRARRLHEAAPKCWRECGNDAGVSGALNTLGWLDLQEGEAERAEARAVEALNVARQMDHQASRLDRNRPSDVNQAMGHFCNCLALNVELGDKPETVGLHRSHRRPCRQDRCLRRRPSARCGRGRA
jgi:hypothetical protein